MSQDTANGPYLALRRILAPAPFLMAMWTVAAWLVFQRSLGSFLGLIILIPVVFAQFAILGIVLWLRPSYRIAKRARATDVLWYYGSLVVWLVALAVPGGFGGAAQLLAVVVTAFAIGRVWRVSRAEAQQEFRDRSGTNGADTRPNAGFPRSAQAYQTITIDTRETWSERPSTSGSRQSTPIDAEIVEEARNHTDDDDAPEQWIARPRHPDRDES